MEVSLPTVLCFNCGGAVPGVSSIQIGHVLFPTCTVCISAITIRCSPAQGREMGRYTPLETCGFTCVTIEENMRKWDVKPTSSLAAQV